MSGFQSEPSLIRTNKAEYNGFIDLVDVNKRKRDQSGANRLPIYPQNHNSGSKAISVGNILFKRAGTRSDTKVTLCASLAGVGAEENALYPDDIEMALAAIKSKYTYMGIAVNSYTPNIDHKDQGFPVAIGGTCSLPITDGLKFEPGDIVRAELALPDRSDSIRGNNPNSSLDPSSYPWRVVPENYTAAGNLLQIHYRKILENDLLWRQSMNCNGSNVPDKMMAYYMAKSDSTLTTVLLGVYVLHKLGIIKASGVPIPNPYVENEVTKNGGITEKMRSEEFVLKLAELFGLQEPGIYETIQTTDKRWFESVSRIILQTVHFNPTKRTMEFGQRQSKTSTSTRNSKTGAVLKGTPAGEFLDRQINHDRILTGATLQALDEHTRFRIGRVISGPGRKHKIDVVLERSHL